MLEYTGKQFGNYRLIKLIGRGGFAHVYLAEHLMLGRRAAIKILRSSFGSNTFREDFLREAQTLAQLKHPNILPIYDIGVAEDIVYLVTEYAPSGTLRQLFSRGQRVPLSTVVSYVKQVA